MKHIKKHSKSRKGDMAEFYAVTWLWDHGYEVFQNSGCTGPIDMIAIKDGDTTFVDVKTMSRDKKNTLYRGKMSRTAEQKELNVKLLGFNPDTRKLRWVNHGK